MEEKTTNDPVERNNIAQYRRDVQLWLNNGLARVGVSDFDVRSPEELHSRVSEFKRKGPYEKVVPRQVYVPAEGTSDEGVIRVRTETAILVPSLLLAALTLSHTDVLDDSWKRTVGNMQGRCATLLPELKAQHAEEWSQLVASLNIPEGEDVEQYANKYALDKCEEISVRAYHADEDLLKAVSDKERMLRLGFTFSMVGGVIGTLVGCYIAVGRMLKGIRGKLSSNVLKHKPNVQTIQYL